MIPTLIQWLLGIILLTSCGLCAVNAWSGRRLAATSRTALIVALLDAAALVVFFRLVVNWSIAPAAIWVAAMALVAIAAGGAMYRWNAIPDAPAPGRSQPRRAGVLVRIALLAALTLTTIWAG